MAEVPPQTPSSNPEPNSPKPLQNQPAGPQNNFGIAGKPLIPQVKTYGTAFETYKAANATPAPAPKLKVEDDAAKLLHKSSPLPSVRTFMSDASESTKKHQTSLASIAAAEQKKRAGQPNVVERSMTNIVMFGISIGLILVSLVIFTLFFLSLQSHTKKELPPPVANNQIIHTEKQLMLTISSSSPENTLSLLLSARHQMSGAPGSIVEVDLVQNTQPAVTLDSQTLFDLMNTQAPSWFERSLDPRYMIGYYNDNAIWQPFMIFKVESYESAFAGMLKWEETMPTDLKTLYLVAKSQPVMATTTATTTQTVATSTTATTTKKSLKTTKKSIISTTTPTTIASSTPMIAISTPIHFDDAVINNKDARVLIDETGTPVLYYSFPDKNTLIITPSRNALREITARMVTSKFVQ